VPYEIMVEIVMRNKTLLRQNIYFNMEQDKIIILMRGMTVLWL
jgi:hypothetical protein